MTGQRPPPAARERKPRADMRSGPDTLGQGTQGEGTPDQRTPDRRMMDQRTMGQGDPGRVTPWQVASWRRAGLVQAGSGGEFTQTRTIATLRRAGVSLRRIRAVVDRLATSRDAPLDELRFALHGRELYVSHLGGAWEGDRRPGQFILDHVVPLLVVDGALLAGLPSLAPAAPATATGGQVATIGGRAGSSDGQVATIGGRIGSRDGRAGTSVAGGRRAIPSDRDEIRAFLARQDVGPAR